MSVQELISEILTRLERQFYAHLPRRDFKRDEKYLIAAIGTYGWECKGRGWEFDLDFVYSELCRLLESFKRRTTGEDVRWMPNYLQQAIRQHIREHAEELKAKSARPGRLARKIVDELDQVKAIVEPSATEQAASIYRDVRRMRLKAKAAERSSREDKKRQGRLL
jgi:hypothetical protein